MLVKAGAVAGEILALKAEVDIFPLAAGPNPASFEQLAFLIPAALALSLCQVTEEIPEVGIFKENRISDR